MLKKVNVPKSASNSNKVAQKSAQKSNLTQKIPQKITQKSTCNHKDSIKKKDSCDVWLKHLRPQHIHTEETLMCVNYEPLFDIGRV